MALGENRLNWLVNDYSAFYAHRQNTREADENRIDDSKFNELRASISGLETILNAREAGMDTKLWYDAGDVRDLNGHKGFTFTYQFPGEDAPTNFVLSDEGGYDAFFNQMSEKTGIPADHFKESKADVTAYTSMWPYDTVYPMMYGENGFFAQVETAVNENNKKLDIFKNINRLEETLQDFNVARDDISDVKSIEVAGREAAKSAYNLISNTPELQNVYSDFLEDESLTFDVDVMVSKYGLMSTEGFAASSAIRDGMKLLKTYSHDPMFAIELGISDDDPLIRQTLDAETTKTTAEPDVEPVIEGTVAGKSDLSVVHSFGYNGYEQGYTYNGKALSSLSFDDVKNDSSYQNIVSSVASMSDAELYCRSHGATSVTSSNAQAFAMWSTDMHSHPAEISQLKSDLAMHMFKDDMYRETNRDVAMQYLESGGSFKIPDDLNADEIKRVATSPSELGAAIKPEKEDLSAGANAETTTPAETVAPETPAASGTVDARSDEDAKYNAIAKDIVDGKFDAAGLSRKEALEKQGYDYVGVQKKVNVLMYGKDAAKDINKQLEARYAPQATASVDGKSAKKAVADWTKADVNAALEMVGNEKATSIWNTLRSNIKTDFANTVTTYDSFAKAFSLNKNIDFDYSGKEGVFVNAFLSKVSDSITDDKQSKYAERVAELESEGWGTDRIFEDDGLSIDVLS